MSHYFHKDQDTTKSQPKTIAFTFEDNHFTFETDHGVFSKDHVDVATALLIRNVDCSEGETLLDLGCGYGVIGIVLAKTRKTSTTMSDVNLRALDLARRNLSSNHVDATVVESDGFKNIKTTFDHIVANPPIRIGKEALYTLFVQAVKHLKPTGSLWLVMHKKHGALSALTFLGSKATADIVERHKGFHVIRCRNPLTN